LLLLQAQASAMSGERVAGRCLFLYNGNAYQDDYEQFVVWMQHARVDWDHAFGVP
jgi:hypothetical protein